ncbi:MAG: hypothetical protein FK734_18400 [Asgard group archaeon]|nr:hypothetical protein [Asgard group archaeon]
MSKDKEISFDFLQKEFRKIIRKIANYLDQKVPKPYPIVKLQEENSDVIIPDYGKGFGAVTIESTILIAKWIMNLQKKEQPVIMKFLFVRESFRLFLYKMIADFEDYQDLIEVTLNIIAAIWIIYDEQIRLIDNPIITIRGHIPFEDDDIFKYLNWDWVLIDSYKYGISAYRLLMKLIAQINKAKKQQLIQATIASEYLEWVELQKQEESFLSLPIYFKQKHFDMLKAMVKLGAIKASAKNVGNLIGKSYNVVDISYKELFEDYSIYWRAKPNILLLRLYPYHFRLTLKNKESFNRILRYLKSQKYLKDIDIYDAGDNGFVVAGTLDCPLIVSNKFSNYLEKLSKQGIILDYFFEMIRNEKGLCTITTNKLKLKKEIFYDLLTKPEKFNLYTLPIFEYDYKISKVPKFKKAVFNEEVLTYLSLIAARYLGKAHYMFQNIDKGYKFCQKNNIDPTNMKAVKSFISQLDFRARRLGAINYYLNIQNIGNFNSSLYCELLIDPEHESLKTFLERIKIFSSMIIRTFYDRVTIHIPKISFETPLTEVIKEELKRLQINYLIYPFDYYREFVPSVNLPFDELYDYDLKKWKYQ